MVPLAPPTGSFEVDVSTPPVRTKPMKAAAIAGVVALIIGAVVFKVVYAGDASSEASNVAVAPDQGTAVGTTNTATLAVGSARSGDGLNCRTYARVISAPPSALMKCANENAVPKCAASAAD